MKALLFRETNTKETISGLMVALTSELLKTTKWMETDGSDGTTAKSFKEKCLKTRSKARV